MKLKAYIPTALVVMAIAGMVALSLARTLHPIPPSKRAFVPEYTCETNTFVGDVCVRNKR